MISKELTYHRMLLHAVQERGDEIGWIDSGVTETVGAHVERSLRLASGLAALGLVAGDRVVVVSDASRFVVNILHSAALGGFIGCPLNTRAPAPELAEILADCSPVIAFTDAAHLDVLTAAVALGSPTTRIVLINADDGPAVDGSRLTLADVLERGTADVTEEPDEDSQVLLIYTGGTTGRSKGAVCDNRKLVLAVNRLHRMFDVLWPGHSLLSVNPLFHIGALNAIYGFPAGGNTVVMRPSFIPEQVMADARAQRITHLSAVTGVLQWLMDDPSFTPEPLQSLRLLAYGGSPMPAELMDRLLTAFPGVSLVNAYGMTEIFSGATILGGADHHRSAKHLASVGRPAPGVRIEVRDTDNIPVPAGEIGEVCVSTGSATLEYWGQKADSIDGWLHTGDLGRLHADGYLYIVDRVKDMIITGSENVYPAEVERVLLTHADVGDVAVIGVPDPRWGERVHAVVVPAPGADPTPDELIAYARARLSVFKTPKTVTVRTEPMPLSSIGKVLKRKLRSEYGGT